MQDLKYYVLWKKDSPLLKEYFDMYYDKLIDELKTISENGILTNEINNLLKVQNRDFILNADQSSIINYLYKNHIKKIYKEDLDTNLQILNIKKEIDLFLDWKYDELLMNKWNKIWDTNIRLSTLDNNPYKWNEAHPHHIECWWLIWYWEKSEKEWLEVYWKTFELLKKVDEWIYDELNQIITNIIPFWTAKGVHNSASHFDCIWHLYMWYTIDSNKPEINILEAIIHESSHNKLNLLMQFEEIVLNDKQEKYYSAIRPDARHIYWIFLWYHAFAPTMYVIMKAYRDWFFWNDIAWMEKITLYYIKTKFLQKMVKKYAKLSDLWKQVAEETDFVISKMDELIKELSPSNEILQRSKDNQRRHFEEVNRNYPYLMY